MMKELSTRNDEGTRRWFSDDYFDLIVWFNDHEISGFQLCYDKQKNERALSWTRRAGYSHDGIDDGESNPAQNRTPILIPDGACRVDDILRLFLARSAQLEPELSSFIAEKLRLYDAIIKGPRK